MKALIFSIFTILATVSCVTTTKQAQTLSARGVHEDLTLKKFPFERFYRPGPFSSEIIEDHVVPITPRDKLVMDLFLSDAKGAAPLVIMVHGNHSRKESHRYQAEMLASWGFHVVTLQVPNADEWLENGKRVLSFVKFVHKWPHAIAANVDPNHILLVGHSFGGSAITLATALGAPTAGLILLDPAVVHPNVRKLAKKISVPIILLGADQKVFQSRERWAFFKNTKGDMLEVSVKGATHDDAQSPSMFAQYNFGLDPFTSTAKQQTFMAAITVAAVSLTTDGTVDFSLAIMREKIADGTILPVNLRTKN